MTPSLHTTSDPTTNLGNVPSTLISRNIVVAKHRTSIRLEPDTWVYFKEICRREHCTMHEICTLVAESKPAGTSLTAAIRVFVMAYFRNAATEDGHNKAGHGQGKVPSVVKGAPTTTDLPAPIKTVPAQSSPFMMGMPRLVATRPDRPY